MTHDLPALCRQIRRDILSMTHAAGSGHPGGSLSAVEILVSLYFGQMRLDPARPDDPNRDRFLLSKGHAAPLADKFRAFGWQVLSVDGHSLDALAEAFRQAAATRGRPTVLLARTVKGKGVSFMEGQPAWHGKAPNDQELAAALAELAEGGTL